MKQKVPVTAKVDPDVKKRATEIFLQRGLNTTQAIELFYRHVVLVNDMPFDPYIPETYEEILLLRKQRNREEKIMENLSMEEITVITADFVKRSQPN